MTRYPSGSIALPVVAVVTVSAPGYYDASFSAIVLSNKTTELPITLAKMATGVVSGVVTDGDLAVRFERSESVTVG